MQIRTKLVIAVVVAMAAVAAITGAVIRVASERNIRLLAADSVASAEGAFAATEREDVEKLTAVLAAIDADPRYRGAFERRDRAALLELARPLFRELEARHGVTHWYFHLPDRSCFLRVHQPDQFGDALERPALAQAASTGEVASGKELGKTAFALRVVRPWRSDGRLIGYLELGEEIDGFLARMKAETGDDYAVLVAKRHLDRRLYGEVRAREGARDDWDDLRTQVVVDATATGPTMDAWAGDVAFLPSPSAFLGEASEGGRTYARGALTLSDAAGRRVGVLVVRSDVTRLHENMAGARRRVTALLILVSALAAGLLVLAVEVLVFSRIRRTTARLEDVSARLVGGDYEVAGALPPPEEPDELGSFEAFFGRFIAVVAETLKGLGARAR